MTTAAASPLRVAVIGAGIGGLSTAIALSRVGIKAEVFERAPELRAIGASLQIVPNALEALHQCGVGDEIESSGTIVESLQFRTARGRVMIDVPIGALARKYNSATLWMPRPELLRVLSGAVDPAHVHLDKELVGLERGTDGVVARFADGGEYTADVVIGADGIESTVRTLLFGPIAPRYAGYQDLRATLDFETPLAPPGTFTTVWGRGARFGIGHAAPGQIFWFAILTAPPNTPEPLGGRKQAALRVFGRWAEPVRSLLEATPADAIDRTDIRDLAPMQVWGKGRVTLLGDAAHATTPNLGRGAAEAIVDAVTIARLLRDADTSRNGLETALRIYEAERRPPTATVNKASRFFGVIGVWTNGPACAVRDGVFTAIPSRLLGKLIESDFKAKFEPLVATPETTAVSAAAPR